MFSFFKIKKSVKKKKKVSFWNKFWAVLLNVSEFVIIYKNMNCFQTMTADCCSFVSFSLLIKWAPDEGLGSCSQEGEWGGLLVIMPSTTRAGWVKRDVSWRHAGEGAALWEQLE